MSETIFGSPNANAMHHHPRAFHDYSDMVLLPYENHLGDFNLKSPAPPQSYFSIDDDYNSTNIQDLQLQLYQELRNQVMWQDMTDELSFSSSGFEHESNSAYSSANTPTFDRLMSSFLETKPMLSVSPVVDKHIMEVPEVDTCINTPVIDTPVIGTPVVEVPASIAPHSEPEDMSLKRKPRARAKPKPKKHKRKHVMPRSKKGCWICRIKHLKCDEKRPHCEACRRFGIECDFSDDRPDYVVDNDLRKQKLLEITRKRRVKSSA